MLIAKKRVAVAAWYAYHKIASTYRANANEETRLLQTGSERLWCGNGSDV